MSKLDTLRGLRGAADNRRQAHELVQQLMLDARNAGATHDEIADALGQHRQQVQRWFKRREAQQVAET